MGENTSNEQETMSLDDVEVLKAKMELISLKLDQQSTTAGKDNSSDKKAWWTTAVEILALPALVVAILLQVSQTTSNIGVPEKTAAETAKIRTEELKARVELESLIDGLAEKKGEGIAEYREEIEKTIPRLEETIEKLSKIERQSEKWSIEALFALYIVLWIVYVGVSLVFEIISHIWSTILNSVSNMIYGLDSYDPDNPISKKRRKVIERLRKIVPWVHSFLGPVPHLIEWAIRLSIFIALLIPFFDQVSLFLGSNHNFESILESAKSLDLGGVIAKLKSILPQNGF